MPEPGDPNALLRKGKGIESEDNGIELGARESGQEDNVIEKEYKGEGIVLEDKGRGLESKAAELYDIDGIFEEGISKEGIIEEGTKDISVSEEAA